MSSTFADSGSDGRQRNEKAYLEVVAEKMVTINTALSISTYFIISVFFVSRREKERSHKNLGIPK